MWNTEWVYQKQICHDRPLVAGWPKHSTLPGCRKTLFFCHHRYFCWIHKKFVNLWGENRSALFVHLSYRLADAVCVIIHWYKDSDGQRKWEFRETQTRGNEANQIKSGQFISGYLHNRLTAAKHKRVGNVTWNSPLSRLRNDKLQSAEPFTVDVSAFLPPSGLFWLRLSVCAHRGGFKGRDECWDERCGGGGVGGTKAATERLEEEETPATGAARMAASLRNLFVVWRFLFFSSFDRLLQVQKRPDAQRSTPRRSCRPHGVVLMEGCLDSSPISPSHFPFLIFLQPGIFFTVKPPDIFPPSSPAGQLVQACLLPRFLQCNPIKMPAECLEQRQPHWSIRKLLIHYSQPAHPITSSPWPPWTVINAAIDY